MCWLSVSLTACQGPRFYERQRVADRACGFDQDRSVLYLRNKIEAAREGSFGGFGGASAGGCGCQ